MATQTKVALERAERIARTMVVGQHMAAAYPTEADVQIAIRQAMGELSGDDAVSEAIAAARTLHQQHQPE